MTLHIDIDIALRNASLRQPAPTLSIDVDQPRTSFSYYRDVMLHLERQHGLDVKHSHLFAVVEPSSESVLLKEEDAIQREYNHLALRPREVLIRIHHRSSEWPRVDDGMYDDEGELSRPFSYFDTIAQVKAKYKSEMGESLGVLTFHGARLLDDLKLKDVQEISEETRNLFRGQLSVTVVDAETTGRQTRLDDVNQAMTVAELKQLYAQKARRVNIDRATLSIKHFGEEGPMAAEEKLSDADTLYQANIEHDAELNLHTPSFTITLREQTPIAGTAISAAVQGDKELQVYDHYTPTEIKTEYNKNAMNLLMAGDALVYKDSVIGDATELFKLRISDRDVIYINREDTTLARFDYMCADCGNDVKLKKTDAVRCRDCGHRILYKKRTTRPCQYLAR